MSSKSHLKSQIVKELGTITNSTLIGAALRFVRTDNEFEEDIKQVKEAISDNPLVAKKILGNKLMNLINKYE